MLSAHVVHQTLWLHGPQWVTKAGLPSCIERYAIHFLTSATYLDHSTNQVMHLTSHHSHRLLHHSGDVTAALHSYALWHWLDDVSLTPITHMVKVSIRWYYDVLCLSHKLTQQWITDLKTTVGHLALNGFQRAAAISSNWLFDGRPSGTPSFSIQKI